VGDLDSRALDLLALDARLRELARRWRNFRRRLRDAEASDEEPFAGSGELARRSLFSALGELERAGDPIAGRFRRWVYRLTEQRIDQGVLVMLERTTRVDKIAIDEPQRGLFTRRELLGRALREPERRAAWLSAAIDKAAPVSDVYTELWQRRQEVARGMGLEAPDEVELPCADLDLVAARWLAESAEAFGELRARGAAAVIGSALGSDGGDAWPTRIDARSMSELWSETRLLEGLDLDPGRWPAALGTASWLRAQARLGAAFVDAAAPAHQPFCIAHDPYGLRRRTLGALFALVALSAPFLQRKLGLGRDRARAQARVVSRVLLLESRAAALRVQLRKPALAGKSSNLTAFEEQTLQSLGEPLPPRAAGTLFRLHVDDGQRFAGLLLAAELADTLTRAHDEDWFRNPRAAEELRAEADRPPEVNVEVAAVERGGALLANEIRESLA
jgi:hypothetical protein